MENTNEIKVIGLTREAWGPRFWKILHTLAEKSGSQNTPIQSNDEADAWILLLKLQTFVMPCALCRKHFQEWHTSHRVDGLRKIMGEERQKWLREWLWGCHKRVNDLAQKESPDLKDLPELYSKKSIEKEFKELLTMFPAAINQQQLKLEDIHRWKASLAKLRVLYGI
jgi:hypothetical protein